MALVIQTMSSSAAEETRILLEKAVQSAKARIQTSDDRSAKYKAALRLLGDEDDTDTEPNTVTVQWVKVRVLCSIVYCIFLVVSCVRPCVPCAYSLSLGHLVARRINPNDLNSKLYVHFCGVFPF